MRKCTSKATETCLRKQIRRKDRVLDELLAAIEMRWKCDSGEFDIPVEEAYPRMEAAIAAAREELYPEWC